VAAMNEVYESPSSGLLWSNSGLETGQAKELRRTLLNVGAYGLSPKAFDLSQMVDPLKQNLKSQEGARQYDRLVTANALKLIQAISWGLLSPEWPSESTPSNAAHLLADRVRQLASTSTVVDLLASWEPKGEDYVGLKRALKAYLEMIPLSGPLHMRLPKKLVQGDRHPDIPKIRKLLIVSKYLSADSENLDSEIFDGPMDGALRAFQAHHGLQADGVLGAGTLQELQIGPEQLAKKIALNLERLREHQGRDASKPFVRVNVPSFSLEAHDAGSSSNGGVLAMKVMVGRAEDNKSTPLFSSKLTSVTLRPYWNVPSGIVRKEIIPAVNAHPGYLVKNEMELVSEAVIGEGFVVDPSLDNLNKAASGSFILRQRPSSKNALGLFKFSFPNTNQIYLHGTPKMALFGRVRRDFSHGCIRLEDPAALAEWLLRGSGDWSRARISEVIADEAVFSRRISLSVPVDVEIAYYTVTIGAGGGLYFWPDIYGLDEQLKSNLLLDQS
jgi:murein L,D-transpeptidase YcbB/YkuD